MAFEFKSATALHTHSIETLVVIACFTFALDGTIFKLVEYCKISYVNNLRLLLTVVNLPQFPINPPFNAIAVMTLRLGN